MRVLIADDDVPTRVGLRTILSSDPDIVVVGEAAGGIEACKLAADIEPDVVLMDVHLPDIDGIEATRRITSAGESAPKVLVLTTFDLDEYVYRSLRAGASGFLLKRAPAEELVAGVHAVASGNALPTPAANSRLIAQFTSHPARPRTSPFIEPLTPREVEVLVLIAHGLTNAEIAETLNVALETVRTHVKHIYNKCGAQDRAHAVIAAYESGLVSIPR